MTFLARGAHLEAMRRDGLRVRSAVDGEWVVKADAVGDVSGGPVADVVLFCVKSFDTESAAEAIRPAVGPDTAVVSLQNGVDNEETLDRVLGAGHAVGGVAYVFAAIAAPGVIAHSLGGRVAFGELDGRREPASRAAARGVRRRRRAGRGPARHPARPLGEVPHDQRPGRNDRADAGADRRDPVGAGDVGDVPHARGRARRRGRRGRGVRWPPTSSTLS